MLRLLPFDSPMDVREQLQRTLGTAYTLERELGGGGMSRVFVAEETALERQVVVKVLPPELTAGVNLDRFKREILLAAKLQHAHIVPVLTAGETNGLPYYTMPFVDGESLRARIARDGPLPITDTISILRDVARALTYAHERGIVHRDIKPENVLLSGGSAVVADFGIAKALSASRTQSTGATLTQVGTSLGTPTYMAPEQAAADPATDHRADIYAFGCVAYELLAGRPPFVEKTPQRLLAAQMSDAPRPILELRPDTPPELAEMVMRCLAKDADDRPQHAGDVVRALDTVTSGGGHAAMPPILLGGPHAVWRALAVYATAFIIVAVVAKAAIVGIGLPGWVFPGSLIVMVLGLPVILFTGFVQRVARRMLTMTPAYTAGGAVAPPGTMARIAMKASRHLSWRRTAAGGAYAFGGFVLLVGMFMLLRALGIGPAGSLLAAGKLDLHQPLIVADFSTTSGVDTALGSAVAEAVRADLRESNAITVMPSSAIREALRLMKRSADSRVSASLARQIALRDGVKAVVTGNLTPLGAGFLVTMRIVGASSGNDLASFQAAASGPTELIPTIGALSKQLRGKIGESLKSVQSSPPLAYVTTASLPALKAYTEGARASDAADYSQAIAALNQALADDSTFAMAWRKLGVTYYNAGMSPQLAHSALAMGYRFRNHLTDRERYTMIGTYFELGPYPDRAKAIEAFRAAVNLGDYSASLEDLSAELAYSRQYAAADSADRLELELDPAVSPSSYNNFGLLLLDLGRWREADSAFVAGDERFGTNWVDDVYRAQAYYQGGLMDSVQAVVDRWKRASDPSARYLALLYQSSLDEHDGRLAAWRRDYQAAVAAGRQAGAFTSPLLDSTRTAYMDVWFRGHAARAVRTLEAALNAVPITRMPLGVRPYAQVAMVYALANRPDRGRTILNAMQTDVRDSLARRPFEPGRHQALGVIALAEKDPSDAIRQFRVADSLSVADGPDAPPLAPVSFSECSGCMGFYLGMAFDEANRPDSAIAEFRRYLDTPYSDDLDEQADHLAYTYRRLGALYEAKGDRADAATYYQKFVDLWKHADPDLQPQVANVKLRLSHLRDTETHP